MARPTLNVGTTILWLGSWAASKEKVCRAPVFFSLGFLAVDTVWPATSASCHHASPGRMDYIYPQ